MDFSWSDDAVVGVLFANSVGTPSVSTTDCPSMRPHHEAHAAITPVRHATTRRILVGCLRTLRGMEKYGLGRMVLRRMVSGGFVSGGLPAMMAIWVRKFLTRRMEASANEGENPATRDRPTNTSRHPSGRHLSGRHPLGYTLPDVFLLDVITRKFHWNQWKLGNLGIDSLGKRPRCGSLELCRRLYSNACPRS